ncbi:MAG: methylated-DNA--[Clostridia bacterium]|nr:methylated-DNA--[protein]-cysteine S-methyltransferase [Clostridia bacterium]
MEYINHYFSPLGPLTLASDGTSLIGLWFDGQQHDRSTLKGIPLEEDLPVFALTRTWLDTYFRGVVPEFLPPLALQGTPFQKAVWNILLKVPYGKTITYGSIAGRLNGNPESRMSAQAVGNAVARNPISLLVPCHRVVGADGSLTGYAGGIEKKKALLTMEQGQHLLDRFDL